VVSKGDNRNDHSSIKDKLRDFLTSLRHKNSGFRSPSLYTGMGFATHLVKAVATSFTDIIAISSEVSDFLEAYDWRVMTLLLADKEAIESDQLDDAVDVTPALEKLEKLLDRADSPRLVALSLEDRQEIDGLFRKHANLIGTPFEKAFLALLKWKVTREPNLVTRELYPILEIEGLLSSALRSMWIQHLGHKEWFQIVKAYAPGAGVDAAKNPMKDYTMHDFITISDKMRANGVLPSDTLEALLGANWKSVLDDLRPIRNDFAHGRMFGPAYEAPDWPTFADTLCKAGGIFNRLKLLESQPPTAGA